MNAYVISGVVGGLVGCVVGVLVGCVVTMGFCAFSPDWVLPVSFIASGFIGGVIGRLASPKYYTYAASAKEAVLVAVGTSIIGAIVGLVAPFVLW